MSGSEHSRVPGSETSPKAPPFPGKINRALKSEFEKQGYIVLRGLLDPGKDLAPVSRAYSDLIDELSDMVCGPALEEVIPGYNSLDFPSRLAGLAGVTRGSVFDHLAPALNIYERGYRRWHQAPSAQPSAMFSLLSNVNILDAVESLIGPEIWSAPGYHLNIKLAAKHREIREQCEIRARQLGVFRKPVLAPVEFIQEFQVGQTPWHMDAFPGLGEPNTHDYIVVWVAMTRSDQENGSLRILPDSHLDGYGAFPVEREGEAVTIEANEGDVVIMHGQTFHASIENQSRQDHRWSFNMRYMPPGRPYGRRFLPGFIARSKENPGEVLQDADLWSQSWGAALDYLDRYELPLKHNFFLTVEETRQLDQVWQKRVPDYESWLMLHQHGSLWKATRCSVRKAIDRLYGRLLNFKSNWK